MTRGSAPSPSIANAPPGWDENPSAWAERLPVAGLAFVGFLIAGYLALYQLDVFGSVWEPFFGDGSKEILHSGVSKTLPVPDAALGAAGYLADVLGGIIGGTKRWRTMPWIVVLFGVAVGPLGAVSVMLVVLQPVVYGEWCTLCLASAAISLIMIGPAADEILASLQYMRREQAAGASVWRTFWGLEQVERRRHGPQAA